MKTEKNIKGMRKLSYKEILDMLRQEFDTRVGLQTRKDDLLEILEYVTRTIEKNRIEDYFDTDLLYKTLKNNKHGSTTKI